MQRYIATLLTLWLYLFIPCLEALNRDYCHDCEGVNYYSLPYCLSCSPGISTNEIPYIHLIPATQPKCSEHHCSNLSVYQGYLDYDFRKYRSHLVQQLKHFSQNSDCICLWPEHSQEAAQISDMVYLLFFDLISTTALSNLIGNLVEQNELLDNYAWNFNKHGLAMAFIALQFRFSDYYRVCRDIENYAMSKYEERDAAKIKDQLQDILEALYSKFFPLYISCYEKHPTPAIHQEIRFMKLLVNDISGLSNTVIGSKSRSLTKYARLPIHAVLETYSVRESEPLLKSDIFLEEGTLCNSLLLYKDAIYFLTQAIDLNPSNRDAYIERATAYFETNQLSLALRDYESARKLTTVSPFQPSNHKAMMMVATNYTPENKTEFSKGLVSGTVDGTKVSAKEFIPSVLSCCRGILNGLWAFVLSPMEVSQEMLNAAYAIGEYIASHSTSECLECVVPELRDISLTWDKINDYSKGQKIGYIIGKYGVDIFAPVGVLKGFNKVQALKRANTMCTLEGCAVSQAKQAKILEESTKLATQRELIINEATKKGSILVRTKNVCHHVMQDHHHWEKVIKLTGNIEEDFIRVIKLLEDNHITNKANIQKVVPRGPVIVTEYQMTINGHEVVVFFEDGETFLKNGYVVTNK